MYFEILFGACNEDESHYSDNEVVLVVTSNFQDDIDIPLDWIDFDTNEDQEFEFKLENSRNDLII